MSSTPAHFRRGRGETIVEDAGRREPVLMICASRSGRSIRSTTCRRRWRGSAALGPTRSCLARWRAATRCRNCAGDARGRSGRGPAVPHVHPRIEAAALAPLLSAAGFTMPVVDVDRVQVSYDRLTDWSRSARNGRDQHPRGALAPAAGESRTNRGHSRLRAGQQSGRTIETFEILHFGAWTRPPVRGLSQR